MSDETVNAVCKVLPCLVFGLLGGYAIHKGYSVSIQNGNQSFMFTPSAEGFIKYLQQQQLQQQQLLPPQTFNALQQPQQVNEFINQK